MFNLEEYIKSQEKIKEIETKIEILEQIKSDLESITDKLKDNCNHNLILKYNKDEQGYKEAKCLICDSYLYFDKSFEMFQERIIDEKKCIDITDKVSETPQKRYKGGENVLVIKAHEKLKEIIEYCKTNNVQLTKAQIKNIITNSLIYYDRDINKEKDIKKLIKRNDDNE